MFENRKSRRKHFSPIKGVFFVLMAVLFVFIVGWVVMSLWNALMPNIFGLKTINYWEAIGLFILFRIFFGGFGGHRKHHRKRHFNNRKENWKKKWMNMEDDEKQAFKEKWKNYCDKRSDNV